MAKKIIIDGVIGWDIWGSKIRKELENTNEEIVVEISSPGGSVYDGLEIFNILRDYSRNVNNVTTKIIGLAASMASYIALAGDRVIAEDNAIYMIHNVWAITIGDYREMRREADIIEQMTNLLAKTYSKKTRKELSEIRELMDNETWLFGEDMVNAGFVDEIIESKKEDMENKKTLLMLAKGRVETCFNMMEKSEKSKNDMKKAAALITNFNPIEKKEKNIVTKKQNKMEEKNNMDDKIRIEELEKENKNLKNEIENIKAHLEFSDIAPNEVLNAIKNNEEFSAKIHSAKYAKLQMKTELQKKREQDNPENLDTKNNEHGETAEETSAYVAKLKARRGIK